MGENDPLVVPSLLPSCEANKTYQTIFLRHENMLHLTNNSDQKVSTRQ